MVGDCEQLSCKEKEVEFWRGLARDAYRRFPLVVLTTHNMLMYNSFIGIFGLWSQNQIPSALNFVMRPRFLAHVWDKIMYEYMIIAI